MKIRQDIVWGYAPHQERALAQAGCNPPNDPPSVSRGVVRCPGIVGSRAEVR